jgi:DNA-binding GntR family transcriptional regulator
MDAPAINSRTKASHSRTPKIQLERKKFKQTVSGEAASGTDPEKRSMAKALHLMFDDGAQDEQDSGSRSLSEVAYEQLLDMLLSGDLIAGSVLQERRLAEALNISRTPVREALTQLEAEGLVTRGAGRLMTVRRISVQAYIEILQVRKLLEGEAAAAAAGRIPKAKADAIRKAIRALLAKGNPTPNEHWAVDDLLHSTIAEAAENKLMADIIRDLRRRTHIFNTKRIPGRLKPGAQEHLAILEAVVAGDATKARTLMMNHIDNARMAILNQLVSMGGGDGRKTPPSRSGY